jgi:PAS domain-containing protein
MNEIFSTSNFDAKPYLSSMLPTYIKSLAGDYISVNQKFLDLLGFLDLEDLKLHQNADPIMSNSVHRQAWLNSILETNHVDLMVAYKKKGGGDTIWARDLAVRIKPHSQYKDSDNTPPTNDSSIDLQESALVVGCLIESTEVQCRSESIQTYISAIDNVLNNTIYGILKLDSNYKLIYANPFLLGRSTKLGEFVAQRMHITELVERSSSDSVLIQSTLDKIRSSFRESTNCAVTSAEIAVTLQLPDSLPQPVSMQFFRATDDVMHITDGVPAILCTIRDLSLPKAILSFLEEYGPRHTLLSSIGIKTLIKSYESSGETLKNRIVWANQAFLNEVGMDIDSVKEKGDKQLFARHFEQYMVKDLSTLARKETLQAIEPHEFRLSDGTIKDDFVFVVKMPSNQPNELFVFYWDFTNGGFEATRDRLIDHLGGLYKRILDTLPFPVFARDHLNRFAYVNLAYTRHLDLRKLDIIGRTDDELFSRLPELVSGYAKVDDICRTLPLSERDRSITVEESNLSRDGRTFPVITTKTAYSVFKEPSSPNCDESVEAIQGILWGKNDIEDRLTKGKALLRQGSPIKRDCHVFVSYAREDTSCLVEEILPTLRSLKNVVTFTDLQMDRSLPEWKNQIESALDECAVGVLLLSPHFFDQEGFTRYEANRLLSRHRCALAEPKQTNPVKILPVTIQHFAENISDELQVQLMKLTNPIRNFGTPNKNALNEFSTNDGDRSRFLKYLGEIVLGHVRALIEPGSQDIHRVWNNETNLET